MGREAFGLLNILQHLTENTISTFDTLLLTHQERLYQCED